MILSEYFSTKEIFRDANFQRTMFPLSKHPRSICYATKESIIEKINNNQNIAAVITTKEFSSLVNANKGVVITKWPEHAYYLLHNKMVGENIFKLIKTPYISPKAIVAPTAILGNNLIINDGVEISDYAFIENNSIIEKNTFIGPYAIIGSRGMQNIIVSGKPFKIKFAGGVRIGKNCEVLAQAIIQKPYQPFFTEIGDNSKISARVSVGHGSYIGKNSMIAGNVTIAGNVCSGDNLWIGPSSVISNDIIMGKNVRVKLGSVVVSNIPDGITVSGNFALDHNKQLRNHSRLKKI